MNGEGESHLADRTDGVLGITARGPETKERMGSSEEIV